ncbi:MAG: type 4a pilus biogenesis protein PilO [candidate division Zixibacteria bacterium]|nr:type 4a pilus biogenesis protein PilO [candidate division Zixibacteria bacterium]
MVDIRDPKHQKLILVVVGVIIIAYGWYSQFYTKADEEINQLNSEYESLLVKLNQLEQKTKNLEALKAEYNDLLISYRPIQKLLPDSLEMSTLLNQIHAAAQSNRSLVFEFNPVAVEEQDYYVSHHFGVKMATSYHDFGKFLADVANFPFIVNITKVTLNEYEDVPKAPKLTDKTVMANFTLTSYNAKNKSNPEQSQSNE